MSGGCDRERETLVGPPETPLEAAARRVSEAVAKEREAKAERERAEAALLELARG